MERSLVLQWHVTDRCNLRCTHCYEAGDRPADPPLAELLRVLDGFEGLLATQGEARGHVRVTGGEPLARADLWELLAEIRRRRLGLSVLTNGTLVDRAAAERLASFHPLHVQVSVDGGAAAHEAVRGPGSFERVCQGARHLVAAGVRILVSFTAHRNNWREFPTVARLGRELGVAQVWADRLVPVGSASAIEERSLRPDEVHDFLRLMRAEQGRRWRSPTEVTMYRALQFLEGGGRPYRCSAGDTLLTVMPSGDVYPCRRMPVAVGNALQTPLAELWAQAPLLRALRERREPARGCEGCLYAELCGGGLRCLASAVHGDPFVADPGCWRAAPRA